MRDRRAYASRRAESRARYSSAGACSMPRLSRERAGEFAGVVGPADNRGVQKGDERCDAPEDTEQLGIEPRAEREVRRVFAPADELRVAQITGGWMIFRITARHACQAFTGQLADRRPERRR